MRFESVQSIGLSYCAYQGSTVHSFSVSTCGFYVLAKLQFKKNNISYWEKKNPQLRENDYSLPLGRKKTLKLLFAVIKQLQRCKNFQNGNEDR